MICGNAMTSDNTTEELKSLAIEKSVDLRLMGLRDDIPQICKCADIGVMPSTREGLGLSGIEMLASGLPIVASNVHGIVDYVNNGVNGYLADPYDSHQFAEGISKLKDSLIRESMKDNCIISASKFDVSNAVEEIRKIYNSLLERERKA